MHGAGEDFCFYLFFDMIQQQAFLDWPNHCPFSETQPVVVCSKYVLVITIDAELAQSVINSIVSFGSFRYVHIQEAFDVTAYGGILDLVKRLSITHVFVDLYTGFAQTSEELCSELQQRGIVCVGISPSPEDQAYCDGHFSWSSSDPSIIQEELKVLFSQTRPKTSL